MQDINAIRGEWKKGVVTETYPDVDDIVRKVLVSYKLKESKTDGNQTFISVQRAVQKLIVLVAVEDD